jgi:hypothetical protein
VLRLEFGSCWWPDEKREKSRRDAVADASGKKLPMCSAKRSLELAFFVMREKTLYNTHTEKLTHG